MQAEFGETSSTAGLELGARGRQIYQSPLQQPPTTQQQGSALTPNNGGGAPAGNPVPLACVPCRSKHLKCSGGEPCARCRDDGKAGECSYVKSRRGYKGPRKRNALAAAPSATESREMSNLEPEQTFPSLAYASAEAADSPETSSIFSISLEDGATVAFSGQSNLDYSASGNQTSPTNICPIAGAFFTNFAAAHPFLPPRPLLFQLLRNKHMPHLELAIQYLGSFYIPNVSTAPVEEALNRALRGQANARDGFMVQALLLYAIGLKANDKTDKAEEALSEAIDIAIGIGMHEREFAARNGVGNRVMEESWRRTWWELYVVDGFFAGVSQKETFRLKDMVTDVPLPCEEADYSTGYITGISRTIQEYDDAAFADDDAEFSSYAYRIDAVRNLGRVLAVARVDVFDTGVLDAVDSYLVNWRLHLPESKSEFVSRDGQLDHMLFQAHMIAESSSILLHQPRSSLDPSHSTTTAPIRTCVGPIPSTTNQNTSLSTLPSPHAPNTGPFQALSSAHTSTTLASASRLCSLLRLPTPLHKHTPFLTCGTVMAAVVHLARWALVAPNERDDALKELIKIEVGSLRGLAAVWPLAARAVGQVRGVAGELWRVKGEVRRLWAQGQFPQQHQSDAAQDNVGLLGVGSGARFAGGGGVAQIQQAAVEPPEETDGDEIMRLIEDAVTAAGQTRGIGAVSS
ncbi:uncharacterized protein J3D65DRAFT_545578 [Phyllosticta citribraziliensis]|uniref:Zn(2)-C6 fungal-type domain-containing protein n=1 Tax=Phyllosticta citribraziliensis TaxID=989973 RepID=A0ABR1MAE8_9PEZI